MPTHRASLAPDPAGVRLGPFWLTPGVSALNAFTLLFGAVSTICAVTFVTFAQPYLFAILDIPQNEQGSLAGLLMGCRKARRY